MMTGNGNGAREKVRSFGGLCKSLWKKVALETDFPKNASFSNLILLSNDDVM